MTHQVPLQSLQDVFAPEELTAFDARIRETAPETEYIVEPKVDGLSVALEYVDGRSSAAPPAVMDRPART